MFKNSTPLRKYFVAITLFICAFLPQVSFASHAVGADIGYTCLGNNQYRVRLTFYRDCAGINAPSSVSINARSASCGRNLTFTAGRTSVTELVTRCASQQNTTRCRGGNNPGFEEHVYEGVITLPAQCTDWVFSYGICCRNSAITNLSSPGSRDLYVEARLNNTITPCDNSPFFSTQPVPFVCVGQQTFYNHGAIDIDGDSLSYTIINPLQASGSNIPFTGGTNINNPVRTNGPFQFDNQTGQMTFTPSQTQNAVVTVLVREYRNGVLIGSTMRDIQVVVVNCPNNNPPIMSGTNGSGPAFNGQPASYTSTICGGNPLCFDINFQDPNASNVLTVTYNNLPAGATITLSGTQPPVATFCWTPAPGQTGQYNFIVTVEDDACPITARAIQSFTINVSPSSYTVNSNVVPPTCPGGSNGAASISISSGAIPPISFAWPSGATGPSVTNIQSGTYPVTITDASNCAVVYNVVVPGPDSMILTTTTTPSVCNGTADGTATVAVTGGTSANGTYGYEWSVSNQVNTNNNIINVGFGNYFVTVTDDNGCTATANAYVFQPGPLVINLSASSISNYNGAEISCFGAADGVVEALASGGVLPYIYAWSPNANNQTTSIINNLGPGTYAVTVTDDNGCNTGTSVTVTEPAQVVANAVVFSNYNGADISCFGANDGSARVTAAGGTGAYTYVWSAAANNQVSRTATNLGPGVYDVTVSDVNNCTAQSTATLVEPAAVGLSVFSTATVNGYNISCFGGNTGAIGSNVTGGTPGYNYSWNDQNSQITAYASDLVAGTYALRVTDLNGCLAIDSTTLSQPPPLATTASITSNYNGFNVSCAGASDGTAIANPIGGVPPYTYVWNDPNSQLTQTVTGLSANVPYTVLVADLNECVVSATVTLNEPTPVTSLTSVVSNYNGRDISCYNGADGAASVLAGGGTPPYSFAWATNSGTVITAVLNGLEEGTYLVTVTDNNNCQKVDSVSLVQPPLLESLTSATRDVSCFGLTDGQAEVVASGGTAGYTYQWDFNAGTQITTRANNLGAGTYNVTVTDVNLCESVGNITIVEPTELVANIVKTDVRCFGDSDGIAEANVAGGTPGYSFVWNTNPFQLNAQAVGLSAGSYDLVVTDNNGCTTTQSVLIEQPTELNLTFTKTDPTCFGYDDGTAAVTVQGGVPNYAYNWNGTVGDSLAIFLAAGDQLMTATDANGCEIEQVITLVDPAETGIDIVPDSSNIPLGGNVQLNTYITTNANASVTYSWQPSYALDCDDCEAPVASPLYNTTYIVEMTDAAGCKTSDTTIVDVNEKTKLYYIPNAFSPNADGYNDVFYIYGKAISSVNFSIFDRWGEKVFESNDLSSGWNGVFKETLMQPGVFVYYAELYFENGDKIEEKGSITLLR